MSTFDLSGLAHDLHKLTHETIAPVLSIGLPELEAEAHAATAMSADIADRIIQCELYDAGFKRELSASIDALQAKLESLISLASIELVGSG